MCTNLNDIKSCSFDGYESEENKAKWDHIERIIDDYNSLRGYLPIPTEDI